MKKIISIICVCCMLAICAIPCKATTVTLYYWVENEQAIITGFETTIDIDLEIPNEIEGYPVTKIGSTAFSGCTYLKSVTIPDTVTEIGEAAFSFCTGLTEIVIPDQVKIIGGDAFVECSGLERVTFPEGLEFIGDDAFSRCTALTEVNLPKSLKKLDMFAFAGCSNLREIIVPEGVTEIGVAAFGECTSLVEATLPGSLTVMDSNVFSGCTALETVHIAEGLVEIPDTTFFYCTNLREITLPASIKRIGDDAFGYCTNLQNVNMLGDAPTFGQTPFYEDDTTITYHIGNETWTEQIGYQYGGRLSWEEDHFFAEYTSDGNATCTADGTKTSKCLVCEETHTLTDEGSMAHRYINGVCAYCGAVNSDAPIVSLQYPTLLLEDEIKMNVYFTLDQDIELSKLGMLTWTSAPGTVDISTADAVIPDATYYSDLGYYGVTTEAIPAQNLGDTVYFCIYAELADGSYAYGKQVQYSPATYAYNQLNGSATDAAKSLYVAILNYGAAAQTYLDYNTDAMINAGLTEDQKAMVDAYSSDMVHAVTVPDATKQGELASNGGFSAKKPSISLDGAFAINYYFTPSAEVSGDMTFYYWNAADFAAADVLSVDNATDSRTMTAENGVYSAAISGIAAKDIDVALYACGVYTDANGNTYSTGILPYSLGVYCGNQAVNGTEKVQPLAAAIAVYGYYAAGFFG